MRGEALDPRERFLLRDRRLKGEPFVDDERIALIAAVEIVERGLALGTAMMRQRGESRYAIRHIVGIMVLPHGARDPGLGVGGREQIEADVLERAAPGGRRVRVE